MKHRFGKHGVKLLSVIAVAAALAACQSQDRLTIVEPGNSATGQPPVSNAGETASGSANSRL